MLNKIRQITNEQQILERQIKSNAETAQRGSALAQQAVEQDLAATYRLTQQKKQLYDELKKIEQQQKQAASMPAMRAFPTLNAQQLAEDRAELERFRSTSVQTAKSVESVQKNVMAATAAQAAMTSGASRSQIIIQQLAFAADDAAISFSTGGFAGALRGASNNLSMVAMMANPVIGALTGIGLTVGGVFIRNWENASKAVEHHKDKIKELVDELKRLDERVLRANRGGAEASRILQLQADQKLLDDARAKQIEARTNTISAQQAVKAAEQRQKAIQATGAANLNPAFAAVVEQELASARSALDVAKNEEIVANTRFGAITNKVQQAQQAEGRRRLRDFGADVGNKAGDLFGNLRKGLRRRADELDPLNIQIQQQQLLVDKARNARDAAELNAGDGAKNDPLTRQLLEKMDQQVKASELLLRELQTQRKEREMGNAVNRRPGG